MDDDEDSPRAVSPAAEPLVCDEVGHQVHESSKNTTIVCSLITTGAFYLYVATSETGSWHGSDQF